MTVRRVIRVLENEREGGAGGPGEQLRLPSAGGDGATGHLGNPGPSHAGTRIHTPPDLNLASLETESGQERKRDRTLYCFRCHRDDAHAHSWRSRWHFSLLLGLTLGTLLIVGPYRCRCCGGQRLMCHDLLSPRFWLQSLRSGPAGSRRRRIRR